MTKFHSSHQTQTPNSLVALSLHKNAKISHTLALQNPTDLERPEHRRHQLDRDDLVQPHGFMLNEVSKDRERSQPLATLHVIVESLEKVLQK